MMSQKKFFELLFETNTSVNEIKEHKVLSFIQFNDKIFWVGSDCFREKESFKNNLALVKLFQNFKIKGK